ncbi:methyltransferase domain-containing protein (plasmid) [Clostridium perfringens]
MFLKINVSGELADLSSYIFAKNPNKAFISSEKVIDTNPLYNKLQNGIINFNDISISDLPMDVIKLLKKDKVVDADLNLINSNTKYIYLVRDSELIRKKTTNKLESVFKYNIYTKNNVEVIFFSIANSIDFMDEFHEYVNEREYLATSIFQSEILQYLSTTLNKEGDYFDNIYDLKFEVGPFKPNLSIETINKLFEPLGFDIDIENVNTELTFKARRDDIIFLKLKKKSTIREALRQVTVLISVIDNFSNKIITESTVERFKRYSDEWLYAHPLKKLIVDRYLNYSSYAKNIIADFSEELIVDSSVHRVNYGEEGLNLNELRLTKVRDAAVELGSKKVLDFGCGVGNLLELLGDSSLELEVVGVDSSLYAVKKAKEIMEIVKRKRDSEFNKPEVFQSSLYYHDSRLKGFDTIILCEVIEHIEYDRVPCVIKNIMSLESKNIIISTPNKDFNKHMDNVKTELRFHDHRFEFTEKEFNLFCEGIKNKFGYKYTISSFGREINGIKPTMMAIFRKEGD